jgi:serine/threonine-protein kinase
MDEEQQAEIQRLQTIERFPAGTIIVERYKVLDLVGKGGFGFVLKAEDLTKPDTDPLAIKIMYPPVVDAEEMFARFKREFQLIKQLSHPNIVQAYEFVEASNGINFFTMEFIEGESLEKKLMDLRPKGLPIGELTNFLIQIASGLSVAHKKSIVHRDVKPENMLVTPEGVVKITDFGVGKPFLSKQQLTQPAHLVGSLPFMAPEQCDEEPRPVDARTDIYGLGITAFLLATGKYPFNLPYAHLIVRAHLESPFPAFANTEASIPIWFERVVKKACAKNPADRFQNAEEFITALETRQIENIGAVSKPQKQKGMRTVVIVAMLAILVGLVILAMKG